MWTSMSSGGHLTPPHPPLGYASADKDMKILMKDEKQSVSLNDRCSCLILLSEVLKFSLSKVPGKQLGLKLVSKKWVPEAGTLLTVSQSLYCITSAANCGKLLFGCGGICDTPCQQHIDTPSMVRYTWQPDILHVLQDRTWTLRLGYGEWFQAHSRLM